MSILTATGTVTINAAFLQEIKEVNAELWQLLEEVRGLCGEPSVVRAQRRRLVTLLGRLRDKLALHFSLEEAYGYFDDPLFVAPHLGERAEELRGQHRNLYLACCELVDFTERSAYRGRLMSHSTEISDRFLEFHARLLVHEAEENELILEAYAQDLGVGD